MFRRLSLKDFLKLVFSLALIISVPLTVYTVTTQNFETRKQAATQTISSARLSEQSYLQTHEPADRQFQRSEIGDRSVYFHQRMVGEAIVEKDFINYQFEKNTGQLSKKFDHWRSDIPTTLPPLKLTKQQAESMVNGQVQFSNLYLISPESDIFSLIKPTPQNPCWVVSSLENGYSKLTIIDAVTGQKLGDGLSPPSQGLSFSGPQYKNPCGGTWKSWYQNAQQWFQKFGFITSSFEWPDKDQLESYIRNSSTKIFYELSHGDSYKFANSCWSTGGYIYTDTINIKNWLENRDSMSFAFIGSCGGMCETGPGTFSYEFRKDSSINSVTVGYCNMAEQFCSICWSHSISWQDRMFEYMSQNNTIKSAFDKALADYPMCGPTANCMRFAGDENYKIFYALTPTPTPSLTPIPTNSPTPLPTATPTPTPIPTLTPTLKPTPTTTPNYPPQIMTTSLPAGKVGKSYNASVTAIDRNTTDTLTMSFTYLPSGLSQGACTVLNPSQASISCLIQGFPRTARQYQVMVLVKDNQGAQTTKYLPLTINPATTPTPTKSAF